jgi:hypothetical protein
MLSGGAFATEPGSNKLAEVLSCKYLNHWPSILEHLMDTRLAIMTSRIALVGALAPALHIRSTLASTFDS